MTIQRQSQIPKSTSTDIDTGTTTLSHSLEPVLPGIFMTTSEYQRMKISRNYPLSSLQAQLNQGALLPEDITAILLQHIVRKNDAPSLKIMLENGLDIFKSYTQKPDNIQNTHNIKKSDKISANFTFTLLPLCIHSFSFECLDLFIDQIDLSQPFTVPGDYIFEEDKTYLPNYLCAHTLPFQSVPHYLQLVEYFLNHGLTPQTQDDKGNSLLLLSAPKPCRQELFLLFLKYGVQEADIFTQNPIEGGMSFLSQLLLFEAMDREEIVGLEVLPLTSFILHHYDSPTFLASFKKTVEKKCGSHWLRDKFTETLAEISVLEERHKLSAHLTVVPDTDMKNSSTTTHLPSVPTKHKI